MAKGILGRKVGMTQLYDESGTIQTVTVIEAGPCHVLQLRTPDRDGYEAVQLGFVNRARHRATRSQRGHIANLSSKRSKARAAAGISTPKPGCEPKCFVRELRGSTVEYEVGQEIKVSDLVDLAAVDVIGTSKGRGNAGVMKRHNFAGQRASHGVKKVHRHAGGTGCSASPSRLFKGRRMAGQYGNKQVTARNLKVVKIDTENNVIVIKGAIPGPNGSFVIVRETNKV